MNAHDVAIWSFTSLSATQRNVCTWVNTGSRDTTLEMTRLTPSRPLKKSGTIACEACLDDTPASGKSLGEGGKLCHQPFSAMSFGNRTRL